MSVKIYENGVWRDASFVRRYNGSFWVDIEYGKRYENGQWIDIWDKFPVGSKVTDFTFYKTFGEYFEPNVTNGLMASMQLPVAGVYEIWVDIDYDYGNGYESGGYASGFKVGSPDSSEYLKDTDGNTLVRDIKIEDAHYLIPFYNAKADRPCSIYFTFSLNFTPYYWIRIYSFSMSATRIA